MTAVKPEQHFRLRFLLNPAYLAVALRKIKSPGDLVSRFGNILRYIWFGLKTRANIRVRGKYYALVNVLRGGWTFVMKPVRLAGDARSDAAVLRTIADFRPGPLKSGRLKNPPSPLVPGTEGRPRLSWNIHLSCNYDCPYCWFHGGWADYLGKAVILSAEDWGAHWARFNDRHGPAHIEIAGGEPFTYPDFPAILAMLARRNTVSVSTNFAWDPSVVRGLADTSKVGFSCSFHPKFAPSAEEFAEKILRLRSAGFHSSASVVAYPPYMERLVSWNNAFFSRGIYLTVQPFRGYWKGCYYPTAYTAAAKRALAWFINGEYLSFYPPELVELAVGGFSELDAKKSGLITSYQMDLKSTLGRSCNSGRLYGRLQFNGDMQRCSQGGYVGNFLDGDFRMGDAAQPCPFPTCECSNEMLYMQGGPLGPKL